MVRQVKKICVCIVALLVLITALCGTVQAATHTVYENGSFSTTYVTYFKDILSGTELKNNYVAFRSGQYSYSLVVGELEYNNGVISLVGEGKEYKFYQESSNYNSQYYYNVSNLNNFSLNVGKSIIYSDVGDFPELIERGAKYEVISAILLGIALCSIVINRIFFKR